MNNVGKSLRLACVSVLALCAEMSSAQVATANAPDGSVTENPEAQVEDIVVTAQRRSENLQNVPISVTAIGGTALAAAGIKDVIGIRLLAPSLNTARASGIFGASIRGVGSFGFSPGIESQVAVYVDGAYIATPVASELSLTNVASVDILKGPQGTLFGRNSTGGLIQVTTAVPTDVPSGNFSLEYGSFNDLIGTGYVAGPLADGLVADLAVRAERRDGFGINLANGSEAGFIDHDLNIRSKIVWSPGSTTTVTAIGNYWDGRNNLGYGSALAGTVNGWTGKLAPDIGPNDYDANINELLDGWSAGGSLKIVQEIGDLSLMAMSAYRKVEFDVQRDLDFSPEPIASLFLKQTDQHFSQELALSSNNNARFKWTVGVFYFNYTSAYPDILVDLLGSANAAAIRIDATQLADSIAGYAQGTYEIATGTNLTLGGRYTSEKRQEVNAVTNISFPGGFEITIPYPNRSRTDSAFTYRISLDHHFSDEVMAYASVNTGFKSGGYNISTPGDPSFSPETLTAFELGLKTELMDRRLRFNTAGFYYNYNDIQVQRVNTFALQIVNGAKARIYGLDADFTAVFSPDFSLTGGLALLNTEFLSFPDCPVGTAGGGVPIQVGSCDGNRLPFSAKFAGTLSANYVKQVGPGELQASANLYYNSGYFMAPDNVVKSDGAAQLGASVKWTADKGYWVSFVGKNLTDNRVLRASGEQTNGTFTASYAEPRTVSVQIGFQF